MRTHNPNAELANGDRVGETPFFTLEKPQGEVMSRTSICKVPLPRIPGDIASGSMARRITYGEGGAMHTVAKFTVGDGTKILGISQRTKGGEVYNPHTPELILQVPNHFNRHVEMTIHLLYAERGAVDWTPKDDKICTSLQKPRGVMIPDGLSYVGWYWYQSITYPMVFVFQPEEYLVDE